MEFDLALIALFAGAFVLRYVRGGVRQLIALGAWLERSTIARSLSGLLVRGLIALLGPLLPGDVRAVYA